MQECLIIYAISLLSVYECLIMLYLLYKHDKTILFVCHCRLESSVILVLKISYKRSNIPSPNRNNSVSVSLLETLGFEVEAAKYFQLNYQLLLNYYVVRITSVSANYPCRRNQAERFRVHEVHL